MIDLEVKALVMGGYNTAVDLLTNNRESLEKLSLRVKISSQKFVSEK